MADGRLEGRILKRGDVVVESRELTGLGRHAEALPAVEAVVETEDERQDHEADEYDDGRRRKQKYFEVALQLAIARLLLLLGGTGPSRFRLDCTCHGISIDCLLNAVKRDGGRNQPGMVRVVFGPNHSPVGSGHRVQSERLG